MTLAQGTAFALGAAAVCDDLRHRKVSNWLTVAAAGALLRKPRAGAIPYAPAIVAAAWLSMLGQR